jgi:hypothetical protein
VSAVVKHLEIRVAWWLFPYLKTVYALSYLLGVEPSRDRVEYWVRKGLTIKPLDI